MNAMTRRAVVAAAAVSTIALGVSACGKAGSSSSSSSSSSSAASASSSTIGLLLPENQTTRYEKFDRPYITNKIKALDPGATVLYANAAGSAATQAQQVSDMITKGAKVLIIDAEDAAAIKSSVQAAVSKGIKVVAYDRLAQGPVSAYVSFDNYKVGQLQGQGLLQAMGAKATPSAKIVEIDGDSADPNAADFKNGFQSVVKGKVDIAYDASGLWQSDVAAQKAAAAITQLGAKNIAAFYSANDGMAGGIATAMKNAGISGLPLTGQDAQVDAIQRILSGTQSFTIYKAYKPEAEAAATLAVDLLQGKDISSVATTTKTSASGDKVPSDLLTPVLVNKSNIKSTVIADGLYSVSDICTAAYKAACTAAGLQ